MKKILGIDLGATAVKVVALDGSFRAHQIRAWRKEPLGPEFLPSADELAEQETMEGSAPGEERLDSESARIYPISSESRDEGAETGAENRSEASGAGFQEKSDSASSSSGFAADADARSDSGSGSDSYSGADSDSRSDSDSGADSSPVAERDAERDPGAGSTSASLRRSAPAAESSAYATASAASDPDQDTSAPEMESAHSAASESVASPSVDSDAVGSESESTSQPHGGALKSGRESAETSSVSEDSEVESSETEPADEVPTSPRSWEERTRDALEVLKAEGWLKAETIACALPSSQVATHIITLPFGDLRKVEQTLPFELEEVIPFELDEVVYDHQVLSRESNQTRLLVAVARKDAISSTLELLASVGVDPNTVTFSAASLMHLSAAGYISNGPGLSLVKELEELPDEDLDSEDSALSAQAQRADELAADGAGSAQERSARGMADPEVSDREVSAREGFGGEHREAHDRGKSESAGQHETKADESAAEPAKGLRRFTRLLPKLKGRQAGKSRKPAKNAGREGSVSEICAVLDIGHSRTGIAILDGGSLSFARTASSGGAEVTAAISRALGDVSMEEAEAHKLALAVEPYNPSVAVATERAVAGLIRELRATFAAWHQHSQRRVQRLILTGGGSRLAGLERLLSEAFDLPVDLLDNLNTKPFPEAEPSSSSSQESQNFDSAAMGDGSASLAPAALALSLALHAVGGYRQLRLNFRRAEFVFTRDESGLRLRSRSFLAMAAVLTLLLGANVWAKVRVLSMQEAQLDAVLCQTTEKILGSCESDYRVALGKLQGQGSPAASIPKVSAADMALSVTSYFPEDKDATLTELEILDTEIRMRGDAGSYDLVEDVVGELQKSSCFGEVRKGRLINKENRIEFDIDVRYTCTQPGADKVDS